MCAWHVRSNGQNECETTPLFLSNLNPGQFVKRLWGFMKLSRDALLIKYLNAASFILIVVFAIASRYVVFRAGVAYTHVFRTRSLKAYTHQEVAVVANPMNIAFCSEARCKIRKRLPIGKLLTHLKQNRGAPGKCSIQMRKRMHAL